MDNQDEINLYKKIKKQVWQKFALLLLLILFLCVNGLGLMAGNIIYQETSVLHTRFNNKNMNELERYENQNQEEYKAETIQLLSDYGYTMQGTYLQNKVATNKTLIFVHGLAANRAAGLPYIEFYINKGFNVLLIDQRAHGASGGTEVTWGKYEKYDLEKWVEWVAQKNPRGEIGVHGISMGAAVSLLHSEVNEQKKLVSFYIADSAYSDLAVLLTTKVQQYFANPLFAQVLLQYANFVAYWQADFTFSQSAPIKAVAKITTPVLYLHGDNDQLIPSSMARALYEATSSKKKLYILPNVGHIGGVYESSRQYDGMISNFINEVEAARN